MRMYFSAVRSFSVSYTIHTHTVTQTGLRPQCSLTLSDVSCPLLPHCNIRMLAPTLIHHLNARWGNL